ncbi:hypothetical protein CYMTET_49540 [Cymbomonas tetramitiformis]|uniref:Uncharacterized protein n=1 Tax=Cymbomonas tetramitiformis TaxID=36881 RepID=A0AAE0BR67_9CHLO|nr:hypothetical protein CYMTET_49540 [Cymbomonas tetramitiformis]
MRAYLSKLVCKREAELILKIIDNVSYSKEVKRGLDTFDSESALAARNVVSDADKIEAIGVKGLERCADFAREMNPSASEVEVDLGKEQLEKRVKKSRRLLGSLI